jgi:uncharacterized protein (DUF2164 family)
MKKIELSKEMEKQLMDEIKSFFYDSRDEEISDFFAQSLVDFIIEKAGPVIYNQAIDDSYNFMMEKLEDIYSLEKRER